MPMQQRIFKGKCSSGSRRGRFLSVLSCWVLWYIAVRLFDFLGLINIESRLNCFKKRSSPDCVSLALR
jgi:hypothetical protein